MVLFSYIGTHMVGVTIVLKGGQTFRNRLLIFHRLTAFIFATAACRFLGVVGGAAPPAALADSLT